MSNAKLFCRTATFGAVLLALATGVRSAGAQTTNLSCSGTLHVFEPDRFDASMAPTSSVVDLAGRKITTPLGTYRISSVHESGIMFGAAPSPDFNFVTFGSLDRLTGKMLISWMTSEQHTKLQAGQTAQASRSAEFNCTAAQRLF
jgi:hypothetical protein